MNKKSDFSGAQEMAARLAGFNKYIVSVAVALIAAAGGSGSALADAAAGATLYASNCQGCHGTLASSSKKGSSSSKIQSAINTNKGGMGSLSSLTSAQIKDIACALGSKADCTSTPTPTPAPTSVPTPTTTPMPSPTPVPATSGAALYAGNCQGCHGPLASSSQRGSSSSEIQKAIAKNKGGMGSLSGLSSTQIKAIACALGSKSKGDCSSSPAPSPTPAPTTAPTPSPSPTCGDDSNPELDTIPSQLDVKVGERLQFKVGALDCDDDSIVIKAKGLPQGASFTQGFDTGTRKQVASIQWTPSAGLEGKIYHVTFTAKDKDEEDQSASSRSTDIRVWPADNATSGDSALVDGVVIQQAQWEAKTGRLVLAGNIKFSKSATKADRRALVANPITIMDDSTQAVIGQTMANSSGQWSAKISLTATTVPCSVDVEFQGDMGSRSVKRAPAQCSK